MQSNAAIKRAANSPGQKLSRLPVAEPRSDETLMAAIETAIPEPVCFMMRVLARGAFIKVCASSADLSYLRLLT